MAMRPPVGPPTLTRRTKILLVVAGVLILLTFVGNVIINNYIDWLWFGEVGFRGVFTTVLFTQFVTALAGGLLIAGASLLSFWLAYRSRPVFVPVGRPDDPLVRVRSRIQENLTLFRVLLGGITGLAAALLALGDWRVVLQFLNSTPFGTVDPEFNLDVGFYAFELPFYRYVLNWLFAAVAIGFLVALVTHYLFGGIRLTGRSAQVSTAARTQLAITAGVFVLLKAVAYGLDRFELLSSDRKAGIFYGATYTDLNAVMPAKLILLVISIICALAFFAAVFRSNLQLPAISTVLLVLSSILIGAAWPAVLEQFVVTPNAQDREAVSIQRNIDATKAAFGIGDDKVTKEKYSGVPEVGDPVVRADQATLSNVRLLDPAKLSATFTQIQKQNRNFYGYPDKLDIDRYEVNGKPQDYIVALRELKTSALTGNQTDWINRRLVYTHGDGIMVAPANQVGQSGTDPSSAGLPRLVAVDLTDKNNPAIPESLRVQETRTYYGELIDGYSIVGGSDGGTPLEYDADNVARSSYTGKGGVPIGNLFNRLVFALHYSERNILFNNSINENSKILYERDPRDRVNKAAPWLTTDADPYPAVVDGRIVWIVDGYTTLASYPYAQSVELGETTVDAQQALQRAGQPDQSISYLRNSVKATVDAYDGTVKLYEFDDKDPVLKTWMKAFPGTVQPKADISPDLQAHFRYPEDQFKVQRELLTRYHVETTGDFYGGVSFWDVPNDPTAAQSTPVSSGSSAQPPYYVLAGPPGKVGATAASFQLTSSLVFRGRENMAAYVSVDSDPANYGKFTVLQLPPEAQIPGPRNVHDNFNSNGTVSSQLTVLRNQNSSIDYGNLLTLPVAGGLVYVEPLFLERAGGTATYAQLAKVLVYYKGRVGFSTSLTEALDSAIGGSGPAPSTPGQPAPNPGAAPAPTGPLSTEAATAATDFARAYDQFKQAQKNTDYVAQSAALQAMDAAVARFQKATGSTAAPAPAPPPGGTGG